MQGSPREVSVKVLSCRFHTSHTLVLVSANSNLYSTLYSVFGVGILWLSGLVFFGGYSKLWDYFGGYILLARDWNLYIIDSQVVGVTVGVSWSWMLHGMSGFFYFLEHISQSFAFSQLCEF